MKGQSRIETTLLSIRVSLGSGPTDRFMSLLYQHFVRCRLSSHLALHSTFLNNRSSSEYSQALLVTHSSWVPQIHPWELFYQSVPMSCFLEGKKKKSCYVLLFKKQRDLLSPRVTKAVWKTLGLKVSILHKGTSSRASFELLYV